MAGEQLHFGQGQSSEEDTPRGGMQLDGLQLHPVQEQNAKLPDNAQSNPSGTGEASPEGSSQESKSQGQASAEGETPTVITHPNGDNGSHHQNSASHRNGEDHSTETTTLYTENGSSTDANSEQRDATQSYADIFSLDFVLGGITLKTYIIIILVILAIILFFIFLIKFTSLGKYFSKKKRNSERRRIQEELDKIMYSHSTFEEKNIYLSYNPPEYSQYDADYV
ncbi:PIR Superfamily Protein [Plasmodium ovale wallikeri]|uniref:PIR Superfamily Protein n=1 Tax=Plasmodium ovale wallikeri TaxID=864142 RepID=A0A1A8Z7U3_PLAOA|nr:PIR Superfamily Protein [Plasmodium ovale wallikeri]SBT40012.1 PIR Superfamily Protein [Plasmodium ovale wallikeri]